jgi:hypothetical protein
MIVIYTPEDGVPREYDAEGLTCAEADAVCRATDMGWGELRLALRNQAPAALRAVAWAWTKRSQPDLRLSHFDPPLRSVKARFITDEVDELLDQVDVSPLTGPQREQVRRELVMLAMDKDAVQAAIDEHDDGPKAPATIPAPLAFEPEEPGAGYADDAEPSDSYAATTSS